MFQKADSHIEHKKMGFNNWFINQHHLCPIFTNNKEIEFLSKLLLCFKTTGSLKNLCALLQPGDQHIWGYREDKPKPNNTQDTTYIGLPQLQVLCSAP